MAGLPIIVALLLPLALSVQAAQQPTASVPPGAQRVEMLSLTLSASCSGDVVVEGVTVTHGGMGDVRDILSVYAMSDGQRVSRGRALSSADGTAALSFRPALVVPACEKKALSIMADYSSDASVAGEHRILLRSAGSIAAGDTAVTLTSFIAPPVRRTAGPEQGGIQATFLPLLTRVTYGDRRIVARLRLASASYDQSLDALTLTNNGSARDADLQDLTLENSRGQVLARIASLRGSAAPFVLTPPLAMERGQVMLLTVRADVRAGRRRTIGFILEEPADLLSHRLRIRR